MSSTRIGYDERTSCPQCREKGRLIVDHCAGDLICTTCGLVLEEHLLDEGEEWRNTVDDMGDTSASRVRADVSTAADEFGRLSSSTVLGDSHEVCRMQRIIQQAEAAASLGTSATAAMNILTSHSTKLQEVVKLLALPPCVVQRGQQLLMALHTRKLLKRSMPDTMAELSCAVLYLACREEHAARTCRELTHVITGASGKSAASMEKRVLKKVAELTKALDSELTAESRTSAIRPEEILSRLVSHLQLSPEVCAPAAHFSRQVWRYGHAGGGSQCEVLASSILIIAWLLNVEQKPHFRDVAAIARVSEARVRHCYQSLRPRVGQLLPENFRCLLPQGLDGLPSGSAGM
eukprot:NODE_9312_length_1432_cov_10.056705.p1 GENE.NODE_9312_length_1432_cov_10.056705~~NODE_9312_length_1432_cov_10.056705.p1  ORF type:complete len:348 (+),score=99.81 NODE_9312_length_1432_cov_10.056705:134-1177(+)